MLTENPKQGEFLLWEQVEGEFFGGGVRTRNFLAYVTRTTHTGFFLGDRTLVETKKEYKFTDYVNVAPSDNEYKDVNRKVRLADPVKDKAYFDRFLADVAENIAEMEADLAAMKERLAAAQAVTGNMPPKEPPKQPSFFRRIVEAIFPKLGEGYWAP